MSLPKEMRYRRTPSPSQTSSSKVRAITTSPALCRCPIATMRSRSRAEGTGVVGSLRSGLFRRDLPQLEERLPLVRVLWARFLVGRPESRRPFANTPEVIPATEHRRAGSELAYPRQHDSVVAHLVERSRSARHRGPRRC